MQCGKCGLETTEFYPRNKVTCKKCIKARSSKWQQEHHERFRGIWKGWYRKNYRPRFFGPFLPRKELLARKMALRRGAEGTHALADINELYVRQGGKCAGCRNELKGVFERDHIMPICLGGSNFIENIQLLCRSCNASKGGKHPDEWRAGKAVA